eukprot:7560012-Alexandrium_andersonii.AAC.1
MDPDAVPAQAGGDTPVPAVPVLSKAEVTKIARQTIVAKSGQVSVPGALRSRLQSVKHFRKWIDHRF